ncbi:MAG: transglycosylase SLT domain-containing protein [Pseudomonadota bacterium]
MRAWLMGLAVLLLGQTVCAFETMQRVRAEGVVRVGVHADSNETARAVRLGRFLAAEPEILRFDRTDALLQALEAGTIDVAATPVDRRRPLPDTLEFTATVDLARLVRTGGRGPLSVRPGSDEWYRAVAMRTRDASLALTVAPASLPDEELVRTSAALLFTRSPITTPAQVVADRQPRAWVRRDGDDVLGFKLDRFIHAEALRDFAAEHAAVPTARLMRAALRGEALTPWDALARQHGRFHGLDWRLLLAVMYKESRFDPEAVSRTGARGLMQLKSIAATEVGLSHYEAPADNVLAGARYLAWIKDQLGADLDPAERVWLALAAYNGGIGTVRRARAHAARMGRDPNRWDGHVARSVEEMARQRGGIDSAQIIGYVDDVRATLATYIRATEPLPRQSRHASISIYASP